MYRRTLGGQSGEAIVSTGHTGVLRTRNGEEGEADAEAKAHHPQRRREARESWRAVRAQLVVEDVLGAAPDVEPAEELNGQAATMAREAYKHLTEEAAKLYMRKIFFAGAVGRAGSMIVFQMP